jgi:hypothetical protein
MRLDLGPRHAPIGSTSWRLLRTATFERHPVLDLRHFELEQSLHQAFSGAREHNRRSLRRLAHIQYVRANKIVDPEVFTRHLLGERKQRLVFAVEQHVHVTLLVALHRTFDDVVQLRRVFVVYGVALGFADALHDHLLGRLRRDPAEVFGRDLFVEEITGLILRPGLLRRNLELGIGDFVNNRAPMEDLVFTGLTIDGDDRVGFRAEVPLIRGQQRGFERLQQHLERNVPLFRNELQDVDEFFIGCRFSHGSSVLSCRA